MITRKTVLVLGAGASAPYDFPTGAGLVELIANDFASPRYARAEKIMPSEYRKLVDEVRRIQPASIDEFLESHPSLADLGRRAIAFHLLPAEDHSKTLLADMAKKDHWYKYLKTQMGNSLARLGENALRVVSFNYDRSVEYYLYETLRASDERVDEETCTKVLKQLPMLHIYGSLGPLPWQSPDGALPYGGSAPEPSADEIMHAGMGIKILHQGVDGEVQQNFRQAQEWLALADRILFLGFGFHRDNVERLRLREILKEKQEISGTCRSLDQTSRDHVEYCTPWTRRPESLREPHLAKRTIRFPNPDADCHTFLYDHVVLS